jgi:heme A synthase
VVCDSFQLAALVVVLIVIAVGVADTKLGQNLHLKRFHTFGIARVFVVKTTQMQDAVDTQMGVVVRQRLVLVFGFMRYNFGADD